MSTPNYPRQYEAPRQGGGYAGGVAQQGAGALVAGAEVTLGSITDTLRQHAEHVGHAALEDISPEAVAAENEELAAASTRKTAPNEQWPSWKDEESSHELGLDDWQVLPKQEWEVQALSEQQRATSADGYDEAAALQQDVYGGRYQPPADRPRYPHMEALAQPLGRHRGYR